MICGMHKLTAGEARVCRVDDPADGVRGRAGVFLTQRHRVTGFRRSRVAETRRGSPRLREAGKCVILSALC